jgi:hypothetical protein
MINIAKNITIDLSQKNFSITLEKEYCGKSILNDQPLIVNKITFVEPKFSDKAFLDKISSLLSSYTEKYIKLIREQYINNLETNEVLRYFQPEINKTTDEQVKLTEEEVKVYLSGIVLDIFNINSDRPEHSANLDFIRKQIISKVKLFADDKEVFHDFEIVFSELKDKDFREFEEFQDSLVFYFLGFFYNVFAYRYRDLMKERYKSYNS